MSRGRPRLADDTIPKGIDQTKLPKGAYWDRRDRVWYTIIEEGAKKRRKKFAGPDAKLSDLHRMLEDVAGVQSGTLGWLADKFHASTKFKELAAKTRVDYEAQRKLLRTYRTSKAGLLADLRITAITGPFLQRVFDKIGAEYPSKANHLYRYVRRVFSWAQPRGFCTSNPAKGLEQATERERRRLPTHDVHNAMIEYARAHYTDYLWIVMELAYLCRLRGIEVLTLTDANEMPTGVETNRRKGSKDSLVLWSPRLSAAWQAAHARRKRIWNNKGVPTPLKPEDRPLLVNDKGKPITRGTLNTLWQRLMIDAVNAGTITKEQRFGSHDLKRRGITDTKGGRAAKKEGGGHVTDAMLDIYDFEIPEVTTPGGV